jgi:hypothetical protein
MEVSVTFPHIVAHTSVFGTNATKQLVAILNLSVENMGFRKLHYVATTTEVYCRKPIR